MTCSFVFQKDDAAPRVEGEADGPELNAGRPFSRLWLHPGRRGWGHVAETRRVEAGGVPSRNRLITFNLGALSLYPPDPD